MQDLFARLINALITGGPDSPDVAQTIAAIQAQSPEAASRARAVRDGWLISRGQPPEQPTTGVAPGSAAATTGTRSGGVGPWGGLSVGAILAGLAATGAFKWDTVGPFLDSLLKNPSATGLLVLVALAGALGGLLNGGLAGSLSWMPGSKPVDGAVSAAPQWVFCPGTVGNALTGAVGAVVAVWLPTWSHFGDPSASRVLGSSLVAAFVVGLGGSRVLTGQRDKALLMAALQQVADRPSDPKLAEALGKVPSALKAVEKVMGPLARVAAPDAGAPSAATEAYLLSLFDPAGLKQLFATLRAAGKPAVLTRDGDGLEIGMLSAATALGDRVPGGVRHFRLVDAARLDRATFRAALAAAGAAVAALPVEGVWDAAQDAAATLARMPATWQLRPATDGA